MELSEINWRSPGYCRKGTGEICKPLTALIPFINAPLQVRDTDKLARFNRPYWVW